MSPRTELNLALDDLREAFIKVQHLARALPIDNTRRGSPAMLDKWLQRYSNELRNLAAKHLPGAESNVGQTPDASTKFEGLDGPSS